jgi:ParB-like chromosome segregation protein Spo0J
VEVPRLSIPRLLDLRGFLDSVLACGLGKEILGGEADDQADRRISGLEELATSIKAHGLLQNLQVRAGDDGKFEVVAGMRRLAALKRLAKEKAIAKTAEIACHVLDGKDARKSARRERHVPTDAPRRPVRSVQGLGRWGKGLEEIAARFGCSPATVRQRLRLANVSPVLIDTYRAQVMSLDQLMAFTVSDDHVRRKRHGRSSPQEPSPRHEPQHPDPSRSILTRAAAS